MTSAGRRLLLLAVLVGVVVSGALLATRGRVAGCERACFTAAVSTDPDSCHLTAACAGGVVLTLVTIAVMAPVVATRAPRPVARARRTTASWPVPDARASRLDRPPRDVRSP